MINGIKPNIKSSTLNEVDKTKLGIPFNEAIDRLLVEIQNSYDNWGGNRMNKKLDLKIGDLVVASNPKVKSRLIIKRIYRIYKNKFDLRGDNFLYSSDSREWGLVELDLIVGKVEKIFTK